MNSMSRRFLPSLIGAAASLLLAGCPQQPTVSTTSGHKVVACDESLCPVMQFQAADFHDTYPDASITLRCAEAREAAVDFANDSVRIIVMARPLNTEEREYLRATNVEVDTYRVAMDAIAVIAHKSNPVSTLSMGALDSILTGSLTRWQAGMRRPIRVLLGDVNSSVDEVIKTRILQGRPLKRWVTRFGSGDSLVAEVKADPDAMALVGLSWLRGHDREVTVLRLGGGAYQPDTTVAPGQYYSPAQAHVLRKYYPLWRDVFMYSREVRRDVGLGFIAYMKDRKGQQNFINHGLVPTMMPVRIVDLSSKQVQQQ